MIERTAAIGKDTTLAPANKAAVRLRAAEYVFTLAVKGIEIEDIEVRLAELQRAAEIAKDRW